MPDFDWQTLVQARIEALALTSLLEVSTKASTHLADYCAAGNIRYSHCTPASCSAISERFDFALVHDVESYPLAQVTAAVGLLKNLLSERVWLLMQRDYCVKSQWIALGFRGDKDHAAGKTTASQYESFSYNLETYNHKRDWNNSRFWANPEHWDKRF